MENGHSPEVYISSGHWSVKCPSKAWPLPVVLVGGGDTFERRGRGREHTHQESDGSSAGLHWGSPRRRHVWVCLSRCFLRGVPEEGDWRHEGPWGLLALV